jgi:predicted transcriptional regulator
MAVKPEYGPVTVSLDDKMRKRLRKIAFAAEVSTSAIVADALKQYLGEAKDSDLIDRIRGVLAKRR